MFLSKGGYTQFMSKMTLRKESTEVLQSISSARLKFQTLKFQTLKNIILVQSVTR